MTTGQLIKKNLGLEKLPNVRICRVISKGTNKLYMIWFDTHKPGMPITTWRVRFNPNVAALFSGTDIMFDKAERFRYTPLMDIEDFNAQIQGAIIVPIDLAGSHLIDDSLYSKILEEDSPTNKWTYQPILSRLEEFITLSDLRSDNIVSDLTKKFRKQRIDLMGKETQNINLVDAVIDTKSDSVTFQFLAEATVPAYPDDHVFQDTNPQTFNLTRNPSKTYELHLRFLQFSEWLDAVKEGKKEGEEITRADIKELLEVSNVQVWSNSPSFHWQGANVNLSQLDGAIYPTDIPAPVWGPRHGGEGEYFLDKHLASLIKNIAFFENQMASMLTRKLKQRNLI